MNKEEARLLAEELRTQKPSLVICGGGHIAYSLAKMADELDFNVTILEDREEYANDTRFPGAKVICADVETSLDKIQNHNEKYFVITSRGHDLDKKYLEAILAKGFTYVGMLGSRSKVATVMKDLKDNKGFDEDLLARVHAPIGEPISAITPAEIAVSILAELIRVKNESGKLPYVGTDVIEAIETGQAVVLATVTEKGGSAPRGVGSILVLKSDDSIAGTVGGGIVEHTVIEKAKEVVGTDYKEDMEFNVGKKGEMGMICGGSMKVRVETIID